MFYLAHLLKLLLLTFILISPFIITPYLFPPSPPFLSPLPTFDVPKIRVRNLKQNKHQPSAATENQFAILIAQDPNPKVVTAKITKTENYQPAPSRSYTIAVLGDSMIDVMQPELPQLSSSLKKLYPQHQFKLLNYGVGASNIEYAAERLTSNYTYLEKEFSSLLSQNPDIIIIESFAYNHGENSQSGLDRQWLALAKIIETIKSRSQAKIVLAAAIGPDENTLCDGIDGINLPPDQKREKAQTIRAYLQNLINFATSQNYPLADAYHSSLDSNGNSRPIYINAGDHLHPSGPGGELLAKKIAEAIFKNNLL